MPARSNQRSSRLRAKERKKDSVTLQWNLVKRLEELTTRLEALNLTPPPAPVIITTPDHTSLLEQISTQNKGILNLIRMLFKLLRDYDAPPLPTSKFTAGVSENTVRDKP